MLRFVISANFITLTVSTLGNILLMLTGVGANYSTKEKTQEMAVRDFIVLRCNKMTTQEMISGLKQLQKDRPNVGANLTLFALINLLIAWFKVRR